MQEAVMADSSPKTQPTAASVADFIAGQADAGRRADCQQLVKLMQAATGERAVMWGTAIVGFGSYRMAYADGRSGEWPLIGFSPRKNELTLYIMPGFTRHAALLAQLGTARTGKSCLYIKRLADTDPAVLAELITASVAAMAPRRITKDGITRDSITKGQHA
jgi:hypothetical protein